MKDNLKLMFKKWYWYISHIILKINTATIPFYYLFVLFLSYQVEVNWEQIQAKIESEYQKEKERPNAKSYGK